MDWRVGDEALCIKRGIWRGRKTGRIVVGQKFGERLVVSEVCQLSHGVSLRFTSWPGCDKGLPWASSRFIKVTPREADTFDREVIAALTGEPVHVPQLEREVDTCHSEVDSCFTSGRSAVQS